MTPVCDTQSYWASGGKQCWKAPAPYNSRYFSHGAHNAAVGLDKAKTAGLCFYATGNGDWALYNYGSAHSWTSGTTTITKPDGTTVSSQTLDNGGWYTWCTPEPAQAALLQVV